IYGPSLKKIRNQGLFKRYLEEEKLLIPSIQSVKKVDFIIAKPDSHASGGTTSETTIAFFDNIPKLVIAGVHAENLVNNDSTFIIRMMVGGPSLIFEKEVDVTNFVENNLVTFKKGRQAIKKLILKIKKRDPFVNDFPRPLHHIAFEGKTVILLGRPGCGKGTQAKMLRGLAGFKYIGSGRELRRLGAKIKILGESLAEGNLAPEIIIHFLLTNYLIHLEKFEPVVLDGTPRKIGEAKALMELLSILGRTPQVFVIDINKDLAERRIATRKNCDYCDISFSEKQFNLTECPECKAKLKIRPENLNKKSIQKILKWHETEVVPVINYFDKRGLVKRIPGNKSREAIFKHILNHLKI
ncbi:MAG: nucleoside monophosphate kinase, partial [bacterium]|nr:nucleoside monophosphate kinase [bacterium]